MLAISWRLAAFHQVVRKQAVIDYKGGQFVNRPYGKISKSIVGDDVLNVPKIKFFASYCIKNARERKVLDFSFSGVYNENNKNERGESIETHNSRRSKYK